ncbi:hypothetical protein [Rhizobium leguminosarum]|uniref:hypothetical protein n=1 Tax=Rhizobium leguminosarum TaxID=384 RepID=UPI003F9C83D2
MLVFEALNALHGDCLLLRYADTQGKSRLWLIDGGPRSGNVNGARLSVWKDVMLPRLKTIGGPPPITIDLGIVSHIDDDHINGIEKMAMDLVAARPHPGDVVFRRFWFNSFGSLVGSLPTEGGASPAELSSVMTNLSLDVDAEHDGAAILQSVGQGISLASSLETLGLGGNQPFGGLIATSKGQPAFLIDDASVTIIGPLQSRLDTLQKSWQKALTKATKKARAAALQKLFASDGQLDNSIPNLSSIVALVEIAGKSLLLTGDARGDDIVSAWTNLELPDCKRTVDLLKVPHHGSFANNPEGFVRFFNATHYVFSADGKHENPDPPVLEGLISFHGGRPVIMHFTNADIKWTKPYRLERGGAQVQTLQEMLDALKEAYPGPWAYNLRPEAAPSVEIVLL